eukprot:3745653-Amphidinium_carterae.1
MARSSSDGTTLASHALADLEAQCFDACNSEPEASACARGSELVKGGMTVPFLSKRFSFVWAAIGMQCESSSHAFVAVLGYRKHACAIALKTW